MEQNKKTGNIGEVIAIKYLQKNDYQIIETNYTSKWWEIDIIAKKDNIFIFVEVKFRRTETYGTPEEALTKTKKYALNRIINYYCLIKKIPHSNIRFDFISIFQWDSSYKVTHYKNIWLF